MPVKFYTGLPGSGKSACMVDMLVELKEKEPGRPRYAAGIDELAPGLAEPLTADMLQAWWELPTGSYVFIDECQECMPLDGGHPPEWVKRMSKVRHDGIDFVLSSQKPGFVSTYVRGLVDEHVHHVRKFRSKWLATYTFPRCVPDPERPSVQKGGVSELRRLPERVFGMYKSAETHTMKMKLPRKFWVMVGVVVVLVVLAFGIPVSLKHLWTAASTGAAKVTAAGTKGVTAAARNGGGDDRSRQLRRDDYVKWSTPRVAGLPWTAPAFDDQPVRAVPAVYCIAVEDGECGCVSEQGTRVKMEPGMCRSIASDGVYNPFKEPVGEPGTGERGGGPLPTQSPAGAAVVTADPLPLSAAPTAAIGGYRRGPSFKQAYIPPEAMPANQ